MTPSMQMKVSGMPKNGCEFLEVVKRKQHGFWLAVLSWWICVVAFILLVSHLFKDVPDAVFMVVFYGGALLLYIPLVSLYRLKCPYCHGRAGAVPFLRYKFMFCKACGERIECNGEGSH